MKAFFASSLLIALTLLASAAPRTSAQTAYPVTVKHNAGEGSERSECC